MKIAIVGAGFCGLALAYYLSQNKHVDITLIDRFGIGGGASGIAAGLLHPYVGFKARLNWRGHEALEESKRLLEVANQRCPFGIVRIPQSDEQWALFQEAADQYDDIEICQSDQPAIFSRSGLTVNCPQYLQSLWDVTRSQGVSFQKQEIYNLDQLGDFDCSFICNGPLAKELLEIRLKLIKGQLLKFEWPEHLPPLKHSIVSKKYVVMNGKNACWVGGTYEHHFDHDNPDQAVAQKEILADLEGFMPELTSASIIDCQAGVRAFAPDKRPFYKQINERTWVFTGMGSKGLLYHALMAKELVSNFC